MARLKVVHVGSETWNFVWTRNMGVGKHSSEVEFNIVLRCDRGRVGRWRVEGFLLKVNHSAELGNRVEHSVAILDD